jgi:hypothetical protein
MQVTIDSRDPLDKALRLVGSLFGVSLTVESGVEAAPVADTSTGRRERKRAEPQRGRGGRGGRGGAAATPRPRKTAVSTTPDLAAVRTWAREQGLQVSDRGRVSNAVLEAYRQRESAG